MTETVILPEMLTAGMEAMAECEARNLSNHREIHLNHRVLVVAVKEIAEMNQHFQTVH